MNKQIALTRAVSPAIANCELTHLQRQPIDLALAQAQHHQYEVALVELGCQLIHLPAEPTLPDSVFVEDTAIVLDELAIITRPGADSRKPETATIAQALAPYRALRYITAPATVDGGDVLLVGKELYVGLSRRSNPAAVAQLASLLQPFGYGVQAISVENCLHLKSAVTVVAADTLLINPAWIDARIFGPLKIIEIDPAEPYAANTLRIGQAIIYPTSYPRTCERLAAQGLTIRPVEASELIKAEGAVTCCSLIFTVGS